MIKSGDVENILAKGVEKVYKQEKSGDDYSCSVEL